VSVAASAKSSGKGRGRRAARAFKFMR
jgi:hypothetical protein